jgi:hypothetical protein
VKALRVLLALEFLAGLGAWAVNVCVWPLAGLVMAGSLVTFLLTWEEREAAPASERSLACACPGLACCGCCNPVTAPCGRSRRAERAFQ